ncbi:acyl-CoA reductase LuxC [Staphylococcus hominis]|uniref:acyl-CoA reductase n=1 Tax=Staphylococcus hominis TaxID=1290 RepID=UPI0008A3D859|nr:acyl-CoA reductase [Staphylococcus hominis]OFM60199.1 acyl-CoA reductase [Staphylococcus sp. HMSC062C01]MCI2862836.1 acyl-CoA reductase [Staphylococcus hominis]MCI2866900.1 acyl-CoA reductase [Staphylococcus hominis]MCI2884521.1 acyl-CoA reductase [Staphylococcus hominis]MCI2931475.1 acyl-CoA reductase [Staphylococcus hominis]
MEFKLGHIPFIEEKQLNYKRLEFADITGLVPILSEQQLETVALQIKKNKKKLSEYSTDYIINVIDQAIHILLDRNSPWRSQVEEVIPQITGYSYETIKVGFTKYLSRFRKHELSRFLTEDFTNPNILNQFVPNSKGGYSKAISSDIVTHLWSGNVPGLPLWSLISSLLVKSGNICKLPKSEPFIGSWFAQIINEIDPTIGACIAVLYWQGGVTDIERVAIKHSDIIIGYGDNNTLNEVSKRIPVTKRFLSYNEKISLAIISKEALKPNKVKSLAQDIALEIIRYDQQGCYSPQMIFIESSLKITPKMFAQMIKSALQQLELQYPLHTLSIDESMEHLNRLKDEEMKSLFNNNREVYTNKDSSWVLIYQEELQFTPSPLNRFIRIMPFDDIHNLVHIFSPFKNYLQTVGIAASVETTFKWCEKLANIGANRFSSINSMTLPEAAWHHDGGFNLKDLVFYVDIEQSLLQKSERYTTYEI